MARELMQSEKNELKILDAISNTEIALFYRLPTTTERIAFNRACWKRAGNKLVARYPEARAEYGELILTGIRETDFTFDGKPIASDSASPSYCKDWKTKVAATAGDLLMLLGMHVFEGTKAKEDLGGTEIDDGIEAGEGTAGEEEQKGEDPEGEPGEPKEGDDIVPLG